MAGFRKALDIPGLCCWLNLSSEQKEIINRIDGSLDILYKCGRHRKEKDFEYGSFRYRDVLNAIEEMKATESVCLSWCDPADFYRIGFISPGDKVAMFRLKQPINAKDIIYYTSRQPLPKTYYCEQFTEIVNRDKARELISTCNKEEYHTGVIDFFTSVLN